MRPRKLDCIHWISGNNKDDIIVTQSQTVTITFVRYPRQALQFLAQVERFDTLLNIQDKLVPLDILHTPEKLDLLETAFPSHCGDLAVHAPFSLRQTVETIFLELHDKAVGA